jgi:hypothetical protein
VGPDAEDSQMISGNLAVVGSALGAQGGSTTGGFFGSAGATENWLPGAVAALGIALITATLLRRWVKRTRATSQSDPKQVIADQRERLQHRAERDSLEKLMVEVQELTRVCAAQIENRATKLEYLIELADRRLAELKALTSDRPVRSHAESPQRRSEERALPHHPQERTARTRDWSAEGEEEFVSVSRQRDQLAERVYELSSMGLKSVEIARQLDEQVGKVELILALREAS